MLPSAEPLDTHPRWCFYFFIVFSVYTSRERPLRCGSQRYHAMDDTLVPPVAGSCDAVSQDSSPQEAGCVGSEEEQTRDAVRDREESEAVKLLDEELAELEQLMRLQRRKVDALERLRQQWLSGERCVCVSVRVLKLALFTI